jgi:disulfide oxidoreductase YuzD
MVNQVEEAIQESGMDAEVQIVDKIEELVRFNTWVLPALVINGKMIARGYVPEKSKIIEEMKK